MEYKTHSFTVHGAEICFSREQDIYNAVKYRFWPQYTETVKNFEQFYSSSIRSFDDIFRWLPDGADRRIQTLARNAVDLLSSCGVLSYTAESFYDEYQERLAYGPCMQELYQARAQIEQTRESQEQYRAMKKASRGRWQGGGFGFSGAIKGAMMAGMMNAGSGLLHGVGDSFAAAGDRHQIENMKRKAFRYVQKNNMLKENFKNCCSKTFSAVIETLEYELHVELPEYDFGKAKATLENASARHRQGQLSKEQYFSYLMQCIQFNPYHAQIYGELYELYPEDDKELQALTEYLHLKIEYSRWKTAVIEDLLSDISEMPSDTIEDVQRKIQALDELAKKHHLSNDAIWQGEKGKAENQLRELLRIKDEQERTALGVLLPTKAEAEQVRSEWAQVYPIIKSYAYLTDIQAAEQCAAELKKITVTHPLVRAQMERVDDQVTLLRAKQGTFQVEMTWRYRKIFANADFGKAVMDFDAEYHEDTDFITDPETEQWWNMMCDMTLERPLLIGAGKGFLFLTDTMLHIGMVGDERAEFVHFPLWDSEGIKIEFPSNTMMEVHTRTRKAQFPLEYVENQQKFKEMLQAFLREASICRQPYLQEALSCRRLLYRCEADLPQMDTDRRERIAEQMQMLKDAVLCANPFSNQIQQVFPNPMWRWQYGEKQYQVMQDIAKAQEPAEIPMVVYSDMPEGAHAVTAFFTDQAVYRVNGEKYERLPLNEITEMTVHATMADPYLQLGSAFRIPAEQIGPHHLTELAQMVGNIVHVLQGGTLAAAHDELPEQVPELPAAPVRCCPSCGEPIAEDARFCGACGQALYKFCASCGAKNDMDAVFCMECGEKML